MGQQPSQTDPKELALLVVSFGVLGVFVLLNAFSGAEVGMAFAREYGWLIGVLAVQAVTVIGMTIMWALQFIKLGKFGMRRTKVMRDDGVDVELFSRKRIQRNRAPGQGQ